MNFVRVMPNFAAVTFMRSTKASFVPATASASITATSLAECRTSA
jgi:hypothetical protein